MRQSRGSKVETEARPCEAEARPSQLKKNCIEVASSRGRCLEDYIPGYHTKFRRCRSVRLGVRIGIKKIGGRWNPATLRWGVTDP